MVLKHLLGRYLLTSIISVIQTLRIVSFLVVDGLRTILDISGWELNIYLFHLICSELLTAADICRSVMSRRVIFINILFNVSLTKYYTDDS